MNSKEFHVLYQIYKQKGKMDETEIERKTGYTKEQVKEIVLCLTQKG